jgi:hypothetical protein
VTNETLEAAYEAAAVAMGKHLGEDFSKVQGQDREDILAFTKAMIDAFLAEMGQEVR